jgi:hypothetical protein
VAFLEHGWANYRGPAAIKVVSRDVEAVLRDVDVLTNREIGERLGVPLPAEPIGASQRHVLGSLLNNI